MIYVPAEVMPASVFARLCKLLYMKPILTRNCSVTWQSSRTELHFRHRVPYSSGWISSPATIDLSQLALDLVSSPASHAYVERLFSLCGDLTARKRNRTRMSLYRRLFLKLNRHILHWTQCTAVNLSVTCFWYCIRTAEDTLQRRRFWLLLAYLVVSRIPH